MDRTIPRQRLRNQALAAARPDPARVVAWLGAVQAQEFGPAKWALAQRSAAGTTDAQVQRAFDAGRILRTHVLRPTWHFVLPADIRWMLELTAPRVHRIMARYDGQLGLDARVFSRATAVIERALAGGRFLTRNELGDHLARAGLPGRGVLLAHIAMHAELEGVICSGPRRGKQSTYALLAERAPGARRLPRDEALAELARRYFQSHGPATARDFAWWSGLTVADAKRGLEMNRARRVELNGRDYWTVGRGPATGARPRPAHLLPIYDEYLIAYRDREAVPHGPSLAPSRPGGFGTFQHALVIGGQVAGMWKTVPGTAHVALTVAPLRRLTAEERRAVGGEVRRYGRFLGVPASW